MKINYLSLLLLLFASCSQEKIDEGTLEVNPYSSTKVTFSKVPLDHELKEAFEELIGEPQMKSKEVDKGFIYIEKWDFYVDVRSAIKTTNSIYDNHTFTFPVIKPGKPYLTANIVLSQNKDNASYSVFLTIYRFTKEQKDRVANGESGKKFIEKPEIYYLKNFPNKSLLKKTIWVDLETLKCYEQVDGTSQGTGWEIYEWEEIICLWDTTDSGGSESGTDIPINHDDPFEDTDHDGGNVYTHPVTKEDHQIYYSFDVTTENPPYTDDYTLSLLEQAHITFRKSMSLAQKMFLGSSANQNFENSVDAFFYSNFGYMDYNTMKSFLIEAINAKMAGGEVDFEQLLINNPLLHDYLKDKMSQNEFALFNTLSTLQKGLYLRAAAEAYAYAEIFYPQPVRNRKGDAVKHALWNALSTNYIGANLTEQLTTAHEQIPYDYPSHYKETNMDLHNNQQGRLLQTEYGSIIFQLVENALANGVLRYLNNLEWSQSTNSWLATNTSHLIPTNQ